MAMKLNQGGKFTRRGVVIEIANEKGTWEKNTLDVTFESADTDELDELRELKAKELLQRKLKGVVGLLDDDGNAISYTEEHKPGLLAIPAAVVAIHRAFWEGVVRSPKA